MKTNLKHNLTVKEAVVDNIPYVCSVAQRYHAPMLSFDDIMHYGLVGLLIAYKKYDESRNVKFLSYAKFYMLREMRSGVRENGFIVAYPYWRKEIPEHRFYEDITEDMLSYSPDNVEATQESKEDRMKFSVIKRYLNKNYSKKDAAIIFHAFGANGYEKKSLKQIGDERGVTRQAVSKKFIKIMNTMYFALNK